MTTKQALKPKRHSNITIYTIESALDLFLQLEELTKKNTTMRLSTVWQSVILLLLLVFRRTAGKNLPTSSTQEELDNWFAENEQTDTTVSKISSNTEHLVLVLKKHQKSFLIYVNGSQKQKSLVSNY